MAQVVRQKEITKHVLLQDGTTEEQREPVFVYVHCYNVACPSYHNLQENLDFERKVPGIREETSYTYADKGGDYTGVENTHVRFLPQDEDDVNCPTCGHTMNVSEMKSYKIRQTPISPGMGLQGAERAAALAASKMQEQYAGQDDRVAELESKLAQQTAKVDQLLAAITKAQDDAPRRGPGRPRKDADG